VLRDHARMLAWAPRGQALTEGRLIAHRSSSVGIASWSGIAGSSTASETRLPFAGLHQLLLPFLDRLDGLPEVSAARSRGLRRTTGHSRMPRTTFLLPAQAVPVGNRRLNRSVSSATDWYSSSSAAGLTVVETKGGTDDLRNLAGGLSGSRRTPSTRQRARGQRDPRRVRGGSARRRRRDDREGSCRRVRRCSRCRSCRPPAGSGPARGCVRDTSFDVSEVMVARPSFGP